MIDEGIPREAIFTSPIQRIDGKVTRVVHKNCLRKIMSKTTRRKVLTYYDLKLECGHTIRRSAYSVNHNQAVYRSNCPECYALGKRTNN